MTDLSNKYEPGFTPRSVIASLLGIIVVAYLTHFVEIIEAGDVRFGAYGLPLPAMFVFVTLLIAGGGLFFLTKRRLLSKSELLVTLFAMFLAVPLVSGGFWSMMIGAIGTIPKTADFETYDAWPEALWPHGDNLIADALADEASPDISKSGRVAWKPTEVVPGQPIDRPVLENTDDSANSHIRIRVELMGSSPGESMPRRKLLYNEPYLLTALLKPENLSPAANYYCRIYYDGDPHFATEAFSSRAVGEVNYLHQTGFLRRGMYDFSIGRSAKEYIEIEIGLTGAGRLTLAEVELINVGTLNAIYHGRRVIEKSRFDALGETERTALLVKPDNMFSLAGIKYIVSGPIPWRDWARPFLAWTSFAALLLLATFCFAIIMRRQWIENERYPLPMTRIPAALLGNEEAEGSDALPPIWKNRTMWVGYGLAMLWCLLRGWHAYNINVPDTNINVQLTPYFTDPSWGKMWHGEEVRNVTFTVTALFVSMAIFMELNVLMSLVVGFFLFRCQYWFGEATGLALKKDFPFPQQQQVGAYIAYALLVLFFTRKHLWRTLLKAFRGADDEDNDEALSPRLALLTLCGCFLGAIAWARWVQIPVAGVIVFFVFLLLIGLVAAKIRAECGTPLAIFTPVNVAQILPMAGGMILFGPAGVLFVIFANWIIFKSIFFLLPGIQLDLVEMGRRRRLPPRHILWAGLLGVFGGLILGGWVFLSLGYGVGGDNYTERWPYMDKGFLVNDYHMLMAEANTTLPGAAPAVDAGGISAPTYGYIFAGIVTAFVAFMRQIFSGFWFHPVGFIIGSTPMLEYVWGSILVAWAIRATTLRLGGAVTVRNKLLPFFIGVFLASLTSFFLFFLLNSYLYFYHPGILRESVVF